MRIPLLLCGVLMALLLLWVPVSAHAAVPVNDGGTPSSGMDAVMKDYQMVRKVAMALSVLGCLLGLAQLGTSEAPSERHRAESLLILCATVLVFLAGDRMWVRGIAVGWFGMDPSVLPAFWR